MEATTSSGGASVASQPVAADLDAMLVQLQRHLVAYAASGGGGQEVCHRLSARTATAPLAAHCPCCRAAVLPHQPAAQPLHHGRGSSAAPHGHCFSSSAWPAIPWVSRFCIPP